MVPAEEVDGAGEAVVHASHIAPTAEIHKINTNTGKPYTCRVAQVSITHHSQACLPITRDGHAVVVPRPQQVVVVDVVRQHHLVRLRGGVLVVEHGQLRAVHEAAAVIQGL